MTYYDTGGVGGLRVPAACREPVEIQYWAESDLHKYHSGLDVVCFARDEIMLIEAYFKTAGKFVTVVPAVEYIGDGGDAACFVSMDRAANGLPTMTADVRAGIAAVVSLFDRTREVFRYVAMIRDCRSLVPSNIAVVAKDDGLCYAPVVKELIGHFPLAQDLRKCVTKTGSSDYVRMIGDLWHYAPGVEGGVPLAELPATARVGGALAWTTAVAGLLIGAQVCGMATSASSAFAACCVSAAGTLDLTVQPEPSDLTDVGGRSGEVNWLRYQWLGDDCVWFGVAQVPPGQNRTVVIPNDAWGRVLHCDGLMFKDPGGTTRYVQADPGGLVRAQADTTGLAGVYLWVVNPRAYPFRGMREASVGLGDVGWSEFRKRVGLRGMMGRLAGDGSDTLGADGVGDVGWSGRSECSGGDTIEIRLWSPGGAKPSDVDQRVIQAQSLVGRAGLQWSLSGVCVFRANRSDAVALSRTLAVAGWSTGWADDGTRWFCWPEED